MDTPTNGTAPGGRFADRNLACGTHQGQWQELRAQAGHTAVLTDHRDHKNILQCRSDPHTLFGSPPNAACDFPEPAVRCKCFRQWAATSGVQDYLVIRRPQNSYAERTEGPVASRSGGDVTYCWARGSAAALGPQDDQDAASSGGGAKCRTPKAQLRD